MDDKKKEPSIGDKIKEGVSMKEIETFARKYTQEVFLILAMAIASISSMFDFFTSAGWSIFFAGIGVIFSIAFPKYGTLFKNKYKSIFFKQAKSTQIALSILRLIVALFLPFIIFGVIGIFSGSTFHIIMKEASSEKTSTKEEK